MPTLITESGAEKVLPSGIETDKIAGLDEDGRIVVDWFDARDPDAPASPSGMTPFLFGLTLCCNASDKGVEDGIVCRGCYDDQDIGNYLYRSPDGTFPGLDPTKEIRS